LLNPIDEANLTALEKVQSAEPVLIDVVPAREAMPGLVEGVLLHAGPPIQWEAMANPLKGAIIGAIRYEGWALGEGEADTLAAGSSVAFHPAHHFDAVGPMTGIITPSMPVFVVENRTGGNRAYCTINEGLGRVLRFGANDDSVIDRLRWIQTTLGPALKEAVNRGGPIELRPLMAQALAMGDEMHQRNVAATSLFFRTVAPSLVGGSVGGASLEEIARFLVSNDQFFLNLAMAAAKATMDAAKSVEGSTMVYAMSRNGTDFGIRVAALGDRWFTAQALMPDGLYFPGFGAEHANPDMGDSAILETLGLGAFAMAGSPAVVGFVGAGRFQDALNYTHEMGEITVGRHTHLLIPNLDYEGVPCGIDLRRVVETSIAPAINTGIAHKEAGVGQVGAGIVRAPMECFNQALEALVDQLEAA
jgi:hypothetical protein